MLDIVKSSSNGNGLNSINGRGLARRHLTIDQRIELAADLACGQQHLHPSIRHVAALLKVLPLQVSERLKTRAQREAERRAAEARWRSQEEAEAINAEAEVLADTWRSVAPESREVAVQMIGSSAVWDVLARAIA
jgi:hypothetical protein